jgi:hypothetical protein
MNMKLSRTWLLAVALLVLCPVSVLAGEETEKAFTGSVETGITGMAVSDDVKRANEYTQIRPDNGVGVYGKATLEGANDGVLFDLDIDYMGPRDQEMEGGIDVNRILRFDTENKTFQHWLDNDQMDYARATMKGQGSADREGAARPNPAVYSENLKMDEEFMVIHREWLNEAELTLPNMPNVTFKAGYRMEEREGMAQAITMSKCASCHVVGNSKDIDERTIDKTLGATGKFGLATIEYEYLDRSFDERADAPTTTYDRDTKPFSGAPDDTAWSEALLTYADDSGELPYSETPDSEKESHLIKLKMDLPKQSSLTASYIDATVESDKAGDASYSLGSGSLENDFEAYSAKAATKIGDNLSLSARARFEELDADDSVVTFNVLDGSTINKTIESAESRDVSVFGADAFYRLSKTTNMRLGYEYEEIEREHEALGETETNTIKLSLNTRPNKTVAARLSYTYQDIDDPFMNPKGVKGPEGGPGGFYGEDFYTKRLADATNQPEEVHEGKASVTWTPSARMSATLYARYLTEENDLNYTTYKRDAYAPGFSIWYAPTNKLNLTMAYNFNKEEVENQMCVGWYHG